MSVKSEHSESWDRAKFELVCLGRTLMPDEESLERTVATLVLFVVWGAIVLGPMFTDANPPRYEIVIGTTAIVFTVIGRMWDFEVKRALNSIPIPDGGQTRDDREEGD